MTVGDQVGRTKRLGIGPDLTAVGVLVLCAAAAAAVRPHVVVFFVPPRWFYLALGVLVLAATMPLLLGARRTVAAIAAAAFIAVLFFGLGSPQTKRERFFEQVLQLEPGTSRAEVATLMREFVQTAEFSSAVDPLEQCETYKHATDGPDEFDVATICYRRDVLVRAEISPD